MPRRKPSDTTIATYAAKRDFGATPEPPPAPGPSPTGTALSFVVQKHQADRARLHWDFRLEHNGVLWSWAVPKGPSMDPADKRMAIHVEDHPLDYADFAGDIPSGHYGAGSVATWDRGTWTPLIDPDFAMAKGHLHFTLRGARLHGEFSLVRLPPRGRAKQEAWLLIKGKDDAVRPGQDAAALESVPLAADEMPQGAVRGSLPQGAVRGILPRGQKPQLCATAERPPEGERYLSEVKFDGYRLIVRVDGADVRLLTRNGLDWTERMPALARAIAGLGLGQAMLDGELVALDDKGVADFSALQAALSSGGRDAGLVFYAFDLLHLDGWDLRPCALVDRKRLLRGLSAWNGAVRYSDHQVGRAAAMLAQAAAVGLEGIVVKQADAPYRAGRSGAWVKVKCLGRAEFVVLGWTPPARSRVGIGALQIGYHDEGGRLRFAGGVGTGFSDAVLADLRRRLDGLAGPRPEGLVVDGDPVARTVRWVRPELVAEISFTDWSADGRLRHAVFLGLREDKDAGDVTRDGPAPQRAQTTQEAAKVSHEPATTKGRIVVAQAPKSATTEVDGVRLSHAAREIWPGITKLDLARYWQNVAQAALPGIARRPLAVLRCPDGVEGEAFFQKNRGGFLPDAIRDGIALHQPYLAIDDEPGLVAMAQMSAIELHSWGADEDDVAHPDRLVFDLDPGEGVAWPVVVRAALEMRERLGKLGLDTFCRTSGGKGLHVVAPLARKDDWPAAKAFCKAFAETISAESPDRYVAHTKIADRQGRILIDWLRNGPGATAIASYSTRARAGATVATPLAWREVTAKLDPQAHTLRTVPSRLGRLKSDPWDGFAGLGQSLPNFSAAAPVTRAAPTGSSRIVVARKPERRA